jgi:hypothetical protein
LLCADFVAEVGELKSLAFSVSFLKLPIAPARCGGGF